MPADPVAVAADQAVALGQLAALGQCFLQSLDRTHPAQPRAQIQNGLDLVQQTASHPGAMARCTDQAQFALIEAFEVETVEIVQQHGLQIGTEHGFHRQLPATFHPQPFGQTWPAGQLLLTQPLGGALAGVQRGLLQGLQRGNAAIEALQLALRLLLGLLGLLQFFTQAVQAFGLLFFGLLQFFQGQLAAGQLFAEFENRRILRVGRQLRLLVLQASLALLHTLKGLLQLLDARLLHLGLPPRFGAALVEAIPLLLPGVHGAFGLFQLGTGFLGRRGAHFLFGGEHVQLFTEGRQQRAVMPQVRFGFQTRALGLAQVILQLTQTLLAVLNALLDPGDITAHRVETALHLIEALGQLVMPVAQTLDAGIGTALLGHQRLEGHFLIADHRLTVADLLVQRLPPERGQLGLELTLLGLVFLIFLGGLGLTMQAFELALQLLAQVGQARQVLVGAADAALGLAAALLVLGDTGGFLDEVAQILGLGLDQLADHALLDDRVAARPEARAEEDVGNVAAPALGAVEEIGVLSVAGHPAADGDFGKGRVLAHQRVVAVVEDQLDGGLGHRLAGVGAVEDDIGHRLAAQVLRRAFAHHPAYGVDDVGLAAAVGPDHRRHVAGKVDRGRIDEGLEARQLDAFEAHTDLSARPVPSAPAHCCARRRRSAHRAPPPRRGRSRPAADWQRC